MQTTAEGMMTTVKMASNATRRTSNRTSNRQIFGEIQDNTGIEKPRQTERYRWREEIRTLAGVG